MMISLPVTMFSPSAPVLQAMANNTGFSTSNASSSSYVHNCWTTHTAGPVDYTNITVSFVNGLIITNGEQNAYYAFTLRCAIYYNGTFYPGYCNGVRDASLGVNFGTAVYTFPTLPKIAARSTFFVTNRRVANDGGLAGTYQILSNTGGTGARQDGLISSNSTSDDFTLGVGVAYGASNFRVTAGQISGGSVTAVTTNSQGVNVNGFLVLNPWYGPAGSGAPGALIPGGGISGYGVVSGGLYQYSVIYGNSGHNPANPPYVFVAGSGTAASGFGANTAAYGPTIIMGTPASATPSVLLQGDSIMEGYNSVDAVGDLKGNFGCYEQTLANRYGTFKLAVYGESAAGWLGNNTNQLAFIDAMRALGLKFTSAVIALGPNDFLGDTSSGIVATVQSRINQIAAIWQSRGMYTYTTTIPPAMTSTDSFVTTANQTAYNSNYTIGGHVDQYNTSIKNGTVPSSGYIDIRAYCQDATITNAWKVNAYSGSHAFCANDGIHPSVPVGIPSLVLNMVIPTLL